MAIVGDVALRPRVGVRIGHLIEHALFGLAAGAQLALRMLYAFHQHVDSDEPQHLHVAWGWTQGLVQYRDVFDNHVPLFHLLTAPLVGLLGERPDIIPLVRIAMLPLTALSLWATYQLGSTLWSPRVGRWGVVMAAFAPVFLLTGSQFRTDVLWTAAWLCALATVMRDRPLPRHAWLAGLWLGTMLITSLKSVVLLAALALAAAAVSGVGPRARSATRERGLALARLAAGFLIPPAVIVAVFWRLRALQALVACAVSHNAVPGLGYWHTEPDRLMYFPASLALVPLVRHWLASQRGDPRARRRAILLLTAGFYWALLEGYWPLITAQDYLPLAPLVALLAAALIDGVWARVAWRHGSTAVAAGATLTLSLVVGLEALASDRAESPWKDRSQEQRSLLGEVLRLTRRGEHVLDLKGETVFRPRPFYYVLEGVTKARIANGSIADRIEADVVRTRTHFAALDDAGFPPQARTFLSQHFVPVGSLRVLGADLGDGAVAHASSRTFDVCYPDRFEVIADGQPARGRIDGEAVTGPIVLGTGSHTYVPAPGEARVLVVWETALTRDVGLAARLRTMP